MYGRRWVKKSLVLVFGGHLGGGAAASIISQPQLALSVSRISQQPAEQ